MFSFTSFLIMIISCVICFRSAGENLPSHTAHSAPHSTYPAHAHRQPPRSPIFPPSETLSLFLEMKCLLCFDSFSGFILLPFFLPSPKILCLVS